MDGKLSEDMLISEEFMSKRKRRIRHGQSLEKCILDSIGRFGIKFHNLYPKVINDYGSVSGRTVHRRLIKLRINRQILKIVESRSEVYYRLSKTK